jgi:hypothetical protein
VNNLEDLIKDFFLRFLQEFNFNIGFIFICFCEAVISVRFPLVVLLRWGKESEEGTSEFICLPPRSIENMLNMKITLRNLRKLFLTK